MAIKFFQDLFRFIHLPAVQPEAKEIVLQPDRPVVILVGGLSSSNDSLRIIKKRLFQDGFNVVVHTITTTETSENDEGLVFCASQLSELVKQLKTSSVSPKQKIFLLAHSAGGLIARYYVQFLEGNHYCDGLITLATPHRGLWIALLGYFTKLKRRGKCLYDILPFSPFIGYLNKRAFPSEFPILSLSSKDDLICPQKSSRLPEKVFESKLSQEKILEGVSHVGFLFQRRPYLVVRDWIRKQTSKLEPYSDSQFFKKIS